MIKTLILLLCFQISIDAVASDADLNRSTNIVTFPRVTVDKKDVYNNVELLLSPSGSWEILKYNRETVGEQKVTGYWESSIIGGHLCRSSFATPWGARTLELLLIQKGNELFGFELSTANGNPSSSLTLNSKLTGSVTGKNIIFEINSGEIKSSYRGIINADYDTLVINSDVICGEGEGFTDIIFTLKSKI